MNDDTKRPARSPGTSTSLQRRQRIVLACSLCGGRNYRTTKARREGAEPLRLKKFCSVCAEHTLHRETI